MYIDVLLLEFLKYFALCTADLLQPVDYKVLNKFTLTLENVRWNFYGTSGFTGVTLIWIF